MTKDIARTDCETSRGESRFILSGLGGKSTGRLRPRAGGQWEIENGLHWICDVTLGEDASRIRTGDAPQNLAAIRSAIISCFRIEKIENIAATLREYTWNPQRLFEKLGRWIN